MTCPQCGTPLRSDAQFCGTCGARLEPFMAAARSGAGRAYGGARAGYGAGGFNEPVPQQGEPQGVLRSGDVAVRIEGELVPVVDVALGALGGREGGCA
jgi:Double zinc ribbon